MPVERDDHKPFTPINSVGDVRRALPTLVAYPNSRAFRVGSPGAVYDVKLGWTEPNPNERERALGFQTGATQALGVTEDSRHRLTGNAIDLRVLVGLIRTAILDLHPEKYKRLQYKAVPSALRTIPSRKPLSPPEGRATVMSLVGPLS